jgi:ATP-dependent Clp protease ATP-binding subunit ClpA
VIEFQPLSKEQIAEIVELQLGRCASGSLSGGSSSS